MGFRVPYNNFNGIDRDEGKIVFFNYDWVPKTKALEKNFLKKVKTNWILLD